MACEIKRIELPTCTDFIYIPTGIEVEYGVLLNLVVTDKFGNKYTEVAEINEDGFLVFMQDAEIYPKGLFTEFGGGFKFEILNDIDCEIVDLTICGDVFKSYQIEFYKENIQQDSYTVCCN